MHTATIIQTLEKHKLELLLLLALSLVAFGLYSMTSLTYPNINEFDPFYHARVTRELIQTGTIPVMDTMSYWPEGVPMAGLYPHLWHYILAGAYWIVALITTGSLAYNTDLFVKVASWVVPFFGAFGVVAMYLLGKEIRGKKAGLFAALLLLFNSNWVYGSIYGEIETKAIGLGMVFFSLFAYVYALKRGGWKNGLFAGLVLATLLNAWKGGIYAALLIAVIAVWQAIKAVATKQPKELENIAVVMATSLVPLTILGFLFDPMTSDVAYSAGTIGIVATLLILATYWFNYRKPVEEKAFGIEKHKLYQAAAVVLILGSLAAVALYGSTILGITMSGFTIGQNQIRLYYTVAEQHSVTFENAIASMGLLGLFCVIALAYFPLRALLKWKDVKNYDLLVAAFVISGLITYLGQNKFLYFFAPAALLATGILLSDAVGLAGRLGKWAKAVAVLLVLALLFAQATIGMAQTEQLVAGYPVQSGWFKTMDWLKTTPQDTALLTWWDYGHWIAFLGERHAIVDNLNVNHTKVETVANIFTEYRANSSEALETMILPQLAAFKTTHVGVDRILLYSKWGALTYIADRQCIPTKNLDAVGLSFPQMAELSKSMCGYGYTYSGDIGISQCQRKTVASEFGNDSFVSCSFIQGAEVRFSDAEWAEIKNTPWPGYTLSVSSSDGAAITLRVYGQPDDSIMFFHASNRLLYDAPINYMYAFRVFFKDPGLTHHELVQNQWLPNEEVVVQKVNY